MCRTPKEAIRRALKIRLSVFFEAAITTITTITAPCPIVQFTHRKNNQNATVVEIINAVILCLNVVQRNSIYHTNMLIQKKGKFKKLHEITQ